MIINSLFFDKVIDYKETLVKNEFRAKHGLHSNFM